MQTAVLGMILIALLAFVAVGGVIGMIMAIRAKRRGEREAQTRDDTANVADLNDRFNRARYMNED